MSQGEAAVEWVGVSNCRLDSELYFKFFTPTRSVAFRANHVPPHKEEADTNSHSLARNPNGGISTAKQILLICSPTIMRTRQKGVLR